jgi:hypothetical protein
LARNDLTDAKSRVGEKNKQNEDVIQIRRYENTYGLGHEFEYVRHPSIVAFKVKPPPG